MTLVEALDQLVAAFAGVGLLADVDPAEVPVPGVWLDVATAAYPTLAGSPTWRIDAYLVAGAGDTRAALAALEAMHNRAVPAVLTPDGDPEFVSLALPADPGNPLPALRLPVDLDL